MSSTAQQLIDSIRSRRLAELSDSAGLLYVDRINRMLIALCPTLSRYTQAAPQVIPSVNGTKEYLVDAKTNQVDLVLYNGVVLQPTSIEELSRGASNTFRTDAADVPIKFYTTYGPAGMMVGLHPTPNAVQNITIFGSAFPAPLVAGSNVVQLPFETVFDEGISYYLRLDESSGDALTYQASFQMEVEIIKQWLKTFSEGYQGEKQNARDS